MKKTRFIIIAVTLLSLVAGYALRSVMTTRIDEPAALREIAPGIPFSPKSGHPPVYRAGDGAVAFNSCDIAPSIRGYAGPIKLMLVMDREGRLTGIRILEHRETKNYVHYVVTPAYLSRFVGKSVHDPFEVDRDVDAVTRATVSVQALARTVKESSRLVAANVLGLEIRNGQQALQLSWNWTAFAILFLLSFAAYFITRKRRQLLRLRDLSLTAGLAVIGLYLSSPFSFLHVLNALLLRPSSSILWYMIVIGTILSALIAGRFYCGWLCPFGTLSEFLGRLPLKKWEIAADTDTRWRRLKYVLLGLVSALVLVSGRVDNGNYETYVTLFSLHGNAFTWSLVAISLITCLRVERFWCRYLCPVAALTGLLSRKTEGYTGRADCPMGNRTKPEISECIRCNRCYTVSEASPQADKNSNTLDRITG